MNDTRKKVSGFMFVASHTSDTESQHSTIFLKVQDFGLILVLYFCNISIFFWLVFAWHIFSMLSGIFFSMLLISIFLLILKR